MAQKKEKTVKKIEDVSDINSVDELLDLEDLTKTEIESEIELGKNLEILEDTCESTRKKNLEKNNENEKSDYKTQDQNKAEIIYSDGVKRYSRGSGKIEFLKENEKIIYQDNLPESQKKHVPKRRKKINNNKSGITSVFSVK